MSFKMKIAASFLAGVFILAAGEILAVVPRTGSCERLRSADDLWWSGKFYESHDIYAEVANSSNHAVLDRVGALQRLALQTWLQSGKADSALAFLNRAVELGEAKASSYTMMSRLLLDEGAADSATFVSLCALNECREFSDSLQAVVAFGRAVIEREKEAYLTETPIDLPIIRDAAQRLTAMGHLAPSEAYLWELSLGLSLLLKDGPSAIQAWRQYSEMASGDIPITLSNVPAQVFSDVLSTWTGNDLDQESCRALVKALAGSRMYDFAKLIAAAPGLPYGDDLRRQPDIAGILNYANLIEQARERINQIYVKRLTADTTIGRDVQELLGMAYSYWQTLDYSGERPEFSADELGAQLHQRWGAAFVSADFSPSSFEITWGHAIYEDIRVVEQYGHKAQLRSIVVDQMVSTGMMGWLTDGDVQIGGWAPTPETIYWIRPAYYNSPVRSWEKVASPEKRKQVEDRIQNLRAADDSLAKADPYAYLPGAYLRIMYAGLNRLYNSLVSSGHTGDELRRAFLREYRRLRHESAIVAHEGRHIIDMAFYGDEWETWNGTRVELNAKLSEILFSPDPWFSVGTSAAVFYSPAAGDTTSAHGSASYLMRKCLVDWMDQHAGEIDGFDRSRPTLPQLDLLSTAQLLTALRTLDPPAQSGE